MADGVPTQRLSERPTVVRHFVLAALLLITAINYVQRNALAITSTTTGQDLGISDKRMGLVLGAFFLSYLFMQVPAGTFAQWLGAKWALVIIGVCWSLATAALGLAQGFADLYFWRLVQGVFQAGIFACATLIVAVWYPATRRGLASALLNSFMIMGSVIGAFLTGHLLEPIGWRWIMVLYALPGLAWAAWFAWWFRGRPQDHPGVNAAELQVIRGEPMAQAAPGAPPSRSIRRSLPALAILAITLLCAQQACRAGVNRLFDNLMPTYLEKERGTTKQLAANLTGWIQLGMVVGGLLGGLLSDGVLRRTGRLRLARNGVALASLTGSVLLYLLAYPITDVYLASVVIGLGAMVFCFSSPCAYALAMDMGGKNLAIVFSLMNMAGNFGAWAFVSFVPGLTEMAGVRIGGIPMGGWDLALGVFIVMHLVAAVCWIFLDPNADINSRG